MSSRSRTPARGQSNAAQEPGAEGDVVRGFTSRDQLAWSLFRSLARGDFRHDFGENVGTRDQFVPGDLTRFLEIAKLAGTKKGNVWLNTKFRDYVNSNLFSIFQNQIDSILPSPPPGTAPALQNDTSFLDEVDLLERMGVDYARIKERVQAGETGFTEEFRIRISEQQPILQRSYTIRAASYRRGPRGTPGYNENQNVASMFQQVTGNKNKFVLIVDASGGLPLTEVLNETLEPSAGGVSFYIVENIENASDSATKIANIKRRVRPGVAPGVTLRFLRDTANTVVYPLWNLPNDPKSNLFSQLSVVLNRISDEEVEADISVRNPAGATVETIHIGDVATNSNVKNASLRSLATYLEKGMVAETLVYALTKRMGDWCQALSMLDLDRAYAVLDESHAPMDGETTTLRKFLVDSEVGVVTNDRILLAFCILLGLNVYFTTAMDTAKLIYFKNNNDVPSGPELEARSAALYATAEAEYETLPMDAIDGVVSDVQAYMDILGGVTSIPEYILKVKNFLSSIGNLRSEFDTLQAQVDEQVLLYTNPDSSQLEKFTAASSLASLVVKLQSDIAHNKQVLRDLADEEMPGVSQSIKIRMGELERKLSTGARITKSVEITEAKEILLGLRDDLKQVVEKNIVSNEDLLAILSYAPEAPNERIQTNYDEILSVLPVVRASIGVQTGGQRGGAVPEYVPPELSARTIRVLPRDANESTSTPNIYRIGDAFVDEKMRQYTVSDEYIVTEDERQLFPSIFERGPPGSATLLYACLKYLILEIDALEADFSRLEADFEPLERVEDGGDEGTGAFEQGTVNGEALRRIAYHSLKLVSIDFATHQQIVDGTRVVYETRDAEVPDEFQPSADEIRASLGRVSGFRTTVVEFLQDTFPSSEAELNDTLAIEESTRKKVDFVALRAGRYREDIVQRIQYDLGIVRNNRIDEAEANELGTRIEDSLEQFMLDIVNSDEDPEANPLPALNEAEDAGRVADIVTTVVESWVRERRGPDFDMPNTLNLVRTVVREIRREEISRQGGGKRNGGRRPLYG